VQSITGKDDQNDKIGDQQREVEGIGVIEALKGLIEVMRFEIMPPVLRRD